MLPPIAVGNVDEQTIIGLRSSTFIGEVCGSPQHGEKVNCTGGPPSLANLY